MIDHADWHQIFLFLSSISSTSLKGFPNKIPAVLLETVFQVVPHAHLFIKSMSDHLKPSTAFTSFKIHVILRGAAAYYLKFTMPSEMNLLYFPTKKAMPCRTASIYLLVL